MTGVGKQPVVVVEDEEAEDEDEEVEDPSAPVFAEDEEDEEELEEEVTTQGAGISFGWRGSTVVWFGVSNAHSCCQAGIAATPLCAALS